MTSSSLLVALAHRLQPPPIQRVPWYDDPVLFARTCVTFPTGSELTAYQADVLHHLASNKRVAQRGPHGLGKTTTAALVVHWFALGSDAAGVDWKIITTAGAWHQLQAYLWPEIKLWAHRLKWDVIGRAPYNQTTELLALNLKLRNGAASAVASTNPALIEGAHAQRILYIFDESKAIDADTFDAAEGAFSVGDAYALASSTPGDPSGRFYDIHQRKPGLEDWWTRHITKDEVVAAGRMNPDWAVQRAKLWGEDSQLYYNRVLGEFHSSDTDSVIPLAWVEAANQRWRDFTNSGVDKGALTDLGVDVARSGIDQTVLARRYGDFVDQLEYHSLEDTMQTTGRCVAAVAGWPKCRPVVDVVGVGAGVVDRLREHGRRVVAFNAGAGASHWQDRSRSFGAVNIRSASWWHMRELLDPSFNPTVMLPPDDLLTGDLVAPKYKITSSGKIQVESKDDIKPRIGRSTDSADPVIQAFWPEQARSRMVHAGRAA